MNAAKKKLAEGKLVLCMNLRAARTLDIPMVAAAAGFDCVFVDLEHSATSIETTSTICMGCPGLGITPLVRVPGHEHHHATRALDNGAQGVVVPHVDTAEDARRIADYCRFPPLGHRSMGGGLQQIGFVPMPVGDAARLVNEETLVVAMLESPRGIENCDAIAAVPGIDALLIGTNDLCFELGIPGRFDDPRVVDAYAKLVAACRKHGKFPGMGGVNTPELLERYIGMGVRLVLAGTDFALLLQAASARASLIRGFAGSKQE